MTRFLDSSYDPTNDRLRLATNALAVQKGQNAASWVFDGNTSNDTYRAYLAAVQNGDESDMFRAPDLSGEFAGEYDTRELAADLDIDENSDIMDELANLYLDAVSAAFYGELERVAHYHIEGSDA
jgi:hypothetical protein